MKIRYDNTKLIKDLCNSGAYSIPDTPPGNEAFTMDAGDKVESTGVGPVKAGVRGVIVSREKNNGFNRYSVKWDGWKCQSCEREQDIQKI